MMVSSYSIGLFAIATMMRGWASVKVTKDIDMIFPCLSNWVGLCVITVKDLGHCVMRCLKVFSHPNS